MRRSVRVRKGPLVTTVCAGCAMGCRIGRLLSRCGTRGIRPSGFKPRGRSVERVPQDVQLGYWLTQHPTLRYISLPRKTGWADAFPRR